MSDFCILVAEGIDETQRAQITAQVKARSETWWHHMSDVWIARSDLLPLEWRDLINPILLPEQGQLLVLRLPSYQQRRAWAISSRRALGGDWLRYQYMRESQETPPADPS